MNFDLWFWPMKWPMILTYDFDLWVKPMSWPMMKIIGHLWCEIIGHLWFTIFGFTSFVIQFNDFHFLTLNFDSLALSNQNSLFHSFCLFLSRCAHCPSVSLSFRSLLHFVCLRLSSARCVALGTECWSTRRLAQPGLAFATSTCTFPTVTL